MHALHLHLVTRHIQRQKCCNHNPMTLPARHGKWWLTTRIKKGYTQSKYRSYHTKGKVDDAYQFQSNCKSRSFYKCKI
jgi:hypothetical protein